MDLDEIVRAAFEKYWYWGDYEPTMEDMNSQLRKNLTDQINGYWSGHSAYSLMVGAGFLMDGKTQTLKKPTLLGQVFLDNNGGILYDRPSKLSRGSNE